MRHNIDSLEDSYICFMDKEKVELFWFRSDDNSYNLEFHSVVLKVCGDKPGFDEVYGDYQKYMIKL